MLQLDPVSLGEKDYAGSQTTPNDKHLIKLKTLLANEMPLTPTSNSILKNNSEQSETDSGETYPTSIPENGDNPGQRKSDVKLSPKSTYPSSKNQNPCDIQPSTVPGDYFSLGVNTLSHRRRGDESDSGELFKPQQHGTEDPRESIKMRRHTSPPPSSRHRDVAGSFSFNIPRRSLPQETNLNKVNGTQSKVQGTPPYFRSNTSMDIQRIQRDTTQDSFNTEISRMRNLIILKRNLQKQRKNTIEDEEVFIGKKISEGHENFVMAYNMLTGIRVAVSRCSGVMKQLSDEDFRSTKKLTFNMDGNELTPSSKYDFKFKDYCPEVFRELRSLFGIDPADYLISITGKYILSELGSPGKSGSFFYYSRDFRFIIKTIHHSEHKQLRKILKDYYSHVKLNPNTLISQFYGLHRLKVHGGMKKIHFLVMNNLFPPHRDIHFKYDLKGSTWGRYAKVPLPAEGESDLSHITLKDVNWLERHESIKFGPQKRNTFLKQLEADVKLLKKINVMDYSLLLGIHDVGKGNSSGISKLSVFDPKSNAKSDLMKTNPRDIDRGMDLPSKVFPGRSKYIFYGHDGGIRGTNEENEPVKVIYYLGVIDCLTNYSFRKRLETFWRSINHSRNTVSAIPADEYGDRFLKFITASISSQKSKRE